MSKKNNKNTLVPESSKRVGGIDYPKFIRSWQSSNTLADAAKSSGMSPDAASRLAVRCRKFGVPLRKFKRHTFDVMDWAPLILLAKESLPK